MTTPTESSARDVLTQVEAESRASRVSNCVYGIDLDLVAGASSYRGDVSITFRLSSTGEIFLDFRGKTIKELNVNGQIVEPIWNGYRLTLPADLLMESNLVRVRYENDYDHQGDGLHQFVDPEDGAEYLFTNFEPYSSHRLFPQFDQPDIKARYSLTVTAPDSWEIAANSEATSVRVTADGRNRHFFAQTQLFSTYLFAMVAGPYHVFRDQHGDIPLGLLCRKSLVEYFDYEEIFTITKQGLEFFSEFFDYPYPFGKYDQCFVPEFNAGAMENVGCITFNEVMVHREPPTDNQRRRRAEVILHEMAHMWFGDLVTMRWWNDLWLNESFATYMAYLAMDEATRFDTGWLDFNASEKAWGYRQDELVTTHPIAGTIEDTDQTFLNFDGITYAKGASVIKQLVASIGMEGFRSGMRRYFSEHEWSNTRLDEFLEALEIGSGHPLKEWSRLWLETASLNTIAANWESDGDRISSMTLSQSAPADYPTIRPHFVELGLLTGDRGSYQMNPLAVRLEGESVEVPEAIGGATPRLVFPNYNDHGFMKVALDPQSVDFAHENLDAVEDTLLRQMLWSSLYTMTRDAQLSALEYLALVRAKIPSEQNVSMVDAVLGQAQAALSRFVPDHLRQDEADRMFDVAASVLEDVEPGDLKIIWTRNLISFSTTPRTLDRCAAIADEAPETSGLTLDQDMRWNIAVRHVAYGRPGAQDRVAAEAERDPTDRGQRNQTMAEVAAPDLEVKKTAWERILGEGYGSLYLTNSAMSGFNWSIQKLLLEPFAVRFFEEAEAVFRDRDNEFAREYGRFLFPAYIVEDRILERSRDLLVEIGDTLPTLRRTLREANDEIARAIRCRRLIED